MAGKHKKSVKTLEAALNQLSDLSGSLNGLAGALSSGTNNPCLDGDELYGLGQLLKLLSKQILEAEESLRQIS